MDYIKRSVLPMNRNPSSFLHHSELPYALTMLFFAILALAADTGALPAFNYKESGLSIVARSNSEISNKIEGNNSKTVAVRRSAMAFPPGLTARDEIKKDLDETYQQCLVAVLDKMKHENQQGFENQKKPAALETEEKPRKFEGALQEKNSSAAEDEGEGPKHCGCSKSYANPNPSDCTCPGACPCQPVEERPECQKKGQKPDYCDSVDKFGPGDECDPGDGEYEKPEETCDESEKAFDEPEETCEQPEETCKEHSGDAEPVEAVPETEQCPQATKCDNPKPCKLTPAWENYVKQSDCLFCNTNKNSIQDAGETCVPKAHPRPCVEGEDDDSDSEDECSIEDDEKGESKFKAPLNPFREAPFDQTFAPKNWPSFQPPASFELPKDFEAPTEFFQPEGPCHGLDSDSHGDFLIKDLMKNQL